MDRAADAPCGYCQPGFIMAAAALLAANPKPADQDIDDTLPEGNAVGLDIDTGRLAVDVNEIIAG